MNTPPLTSMRAAWFMLILASIGTGLAIAENEADKARGIEREYVKPGFVACTSQGAMELYQGSNTRHQVELYMSEKCLTTDVLVAYRFVVLNEGTPTINKIRLELDDDQFADLFIPVEAITDKGAM